MVKLTTTVPVQTIQTPISYSNTSMFIGSCFTENMSRKMSALGFKTYTNPFGILYNPISILKCLQFVAGNKKLGDEAVFFYNELWHSYYHHGCFSNIQKEECLQNCNAEIQKAHQFFKKTDMLAITLGSAWLYTRKDNEITVGNCHKLPSATFNKSLLDLAGTVTDYLSVLEQLKKVNPQLQFVFTISPVRHWNDGFRENQISKSILHLLVHEIQQSMPEVLYFPAYEIQMDELRDYRFYDADLLHPNVLAGNYIWEKLKDFLFKEGTIREMETVENFKKMYFHKSLYHDTEAFKKHQEKTRQLLNNLQQEKPDLDFDGILKIPM